MNCNQQNNHDEPWKVLTLEQDSKHDTVLFTDETGTSHWVCGTCGQNFLPRPK